jgi:hypothetical protein
MIFRLTLFAVFIIRGFYYSRFLLFAVSIIRSFYYSQFHDDVGINVKFYRFMQVRGKCKVNLIIQWRTWILKLTGRKQIFFSKINTG